jgi:molybdenum cofactor biosynthesis enzyme MoaA
MDVGNDNGWDFSKVVTKDEMLSMVEEHFDIEPVEPKYFGEVAKYYRNLISMPLYLKYSIIGMIWSSLTPF